MALRLPFWVWVGVFSARPRNVALALCPPRSLSRFVYVAPSLTTLLGAAFLSAPHRHGHEEDHEHDGDCHHDHDDAGANREHNKAGAHPVLLPAILPASIAATTVKPGAAQQGSSSG
jgi:hypothetical protein